MYQLLPNIAPFPGKAASPPLGRGGSRKVKGSVERPGAGRQAGSGGKLAAAAPVAGLPPRLPPLSGRYGGGGGVGDWPRVLEQLPPALGPPGMREQAAHQDFYGNLLLETAAAAARGLPAAGAAAAPRPSPFPRRRTRAASPRATRAIAVAAPGG